MSTFSIPDFIENPKGYVKKVSIDDIMDFLELANEYYRNNADTLISDDLYDWIEEYARKKKPSHPFFKKIGAPTQDKELLPEWMGSLDKIRDDPKALSAWTSKYNPPYVISEKLDGNSGMFALTKSKTVQMFTRGDGTYGRNISSILKYLEGSYKSVDEMMTNREINMKKDYPLLVRGELIISKKGWDKIKHKGSNARNVAAGTLNAKHPDEEIAKHLEFVAYELIEPRMPFFEGLEFIKKLGFNTVYHHMIDPQEVNNDSLSKYLLQRRKESLYEIDGIVIRDNAAHNIIKGKNPKYAFAYKTIHTHEEAEVVVLKIDWNVSKDGLIKPTVHFTPVYINNVRIKQASGFNGDFIERNNLGIGSKIRIIRSGDVIPHIVSVITSSTTGKPYMPTIPYEWTESHVDIRIKKDADNDQMKLRQLEHFVKTLDITYVGEGILKKLFEKGIDTIPKFLSLQKADLLLVEGIKEKTAEKIYESIKAKYGNTNCLQLMVASNLFGRGFGERRVKSILETNPEILDMKLITSLKQTEGIGEITEKQFLDNLPKFYEFLAYIGYKCKKEAPVPPTKEKDMVFKDMSLIFTGFRNKDWETRIEELGGNMVSSVSKKTSIVIAIDKDEDSAKINKAKTLGLVIYNKEEFIKKYRKYGFS